MSTTPSPTLSESNSTVTVITSTTQDAKLIVSVALTLALVLLLLMLAQLMVRSKVRHTRLQQVRRKVRLDIEWYAQKLTEKDPRKKIIENSKAILKYRITDPPQYHTRVIPSVMQDGPSVMKDWRLECVNMHKKLAGALPASKFGGIDLRRLSMRALVNAVQYALDPDELEKFLQIYESVILGIHTGDGTFGDVSPLDLRFMHQYFSSNIMKEVSG